MKCINCNNEEVVFDTVSEMYYCEKCGTLFEEGEIKNKGNKKDCAKKHVKNNTLSLFSHVVLNTVQSMPIVGLIVPLLVSSTQISEYDRKYYTSRFISQILQCICIALVYAVFIAGAKEARSMYLHDMINGVNGYFITMADSHIDIKYTYVPVKVLDKLEPLKPDVESEYVDSMYLLDGSTIKGKSVSTILTDLNNQEDITILLQTTGIAKRYGKTTYRNFGQAIEGIELKTNEPCYIKDVGDTITPLLDDYGNVIRLGLKDLEDSKSIFYVKEDSNFTIKCFYNEDGTLIGVMLTETK